MELMFFICAASFIYSFIGYPLIIGLLARKNGTPDLLHNRLPELTVILCVYNASPLLSFRIKNILESDYPTEKINILVVSDGSTDGPEHIVDSLNNPLVKLIHYSKNQGKSFALNQGLRAVETDLVAFTDIRQRFDKHALMQLSSHFLDPKTAAVTGNLHIITDENNTEDDPGLYWKYEKWIREKESDFKSMLGVTGAIYMARRNLIPEIPTDIILDDMYIPLTMVNAGYHIKFENKAIAYDVSSSTTAEEFHRKVRTLAGNFQLISYMPWLLSPRKNPLFFQFVSHKVMRLIMPYCLIALLVSSYLINTTNFFLLFLLQILFYLYTAIAYIAAINNIKMPFSSVFISFCSLHIASFLAGWKYKFSDTKTLWKKH
ncbi:MAG: glycosyltransferase [Litorilituus sp.]|jgi:cellulose synthase/poly-beta-1,6-N-acetylglucosamine synthase-like glycosyltransferase|nr:glycosyltransferase [Litorilituus sp.]